MFDVRSQAEQVEQTMARETMFARFSASFAVIAMLLAAIGLYGAMAHMVARRAAEIALRMALGVRRVAVVEMVVRQALVLVAIGVAIGVPLTVGAARLAGTVLDQMLFGLEPYDPLLVSGAAAMLALVAIVEADANSPPAEFDGKELVSGTFVGLPVRSSEGTFNVESGTLMLALGTQKTEDVLLTLEGTGGERRGDRPHHGRNGHTVNSG